MISKLLNKIKNISGKNKEVYKSIILSFLIRGLAIVLSLFTLPAYMNFFDNKVVLGLWFTIVSILSWMLNFDFGIGNGLRNKLVPCLVNDDKEKIKKYISSSYIIISIVSIIVFIISFIVIPLLNWNTIFNVPEITISNKLLIKVVTIVFAGILLQFVLRLINSILYALQKSHIPALLSLITSALNLLFVILLPNQTVEQNIIILAYINIFTVNVPLIIATLVIFKKNFSYAIPRFKYYTKKYAKDIMKLGGLFFGIQIMYMIITNTNEYMVTYFYNPEYVVDYQIYNKLFNLIGTVFSLTMVPIWSSITKALSENDYVWIKKTYKKLFMLAGCFILGEFILIPFLQFFVNIWLGSESIQINYIYAICFAIYGSIFIWSSVVSSMSNGLGKVKSQFVLMTCAVIIEFALLFIVTKQIDKWITIVIINSIAMLPYCITQTIINNKYINMLNNKEGEK